MQRPVIHTFRNSVKNTEPEAIIYTQNLCGIIIIIIIFLLLFCLKALAYYETVLAIYCWACSLP